MTSVDLPEPRDARDARERTERDGHVEVLQVVLGGAAHLEPCPRAGLRRAGRSGSAGAARKAPVSESGRARPRRASPGRRPRRRARRRRAHVDDLVGRAHRLLVVLDDHQGVADVAQALQGRDQAPVVARVQPDRRLVEDVQHADQARAELGRQADPLRLAAGERVRRAVERQVAQPDVDEEAQAGADLVQDSPAMRVWRAAAGPRPGAPASVIGRANLAEREVRRTARPGRGGGGPLALGAGPDEAHGVLAHRPRIELACGEAAAGRPDPAPGAVALQAASVPHALTLALGPWQHDPRARGEAPSRACRGRVSVLRDRLEEQVVARWSVPTGRTRRRRGSGGGRPPARGRPRACIRAPCSAGRRRGAS